MQSLQNSEHCHASCSADCFHVLDHASTSFQLKIKEDIHIQREQPSLLSCRMAIQVGKWVDISVLFILVVFIFSVSVKVLPVTPLLSGVFVHGAFCAYFLRIERVVGNE